MGPPATKLIYAGNPALGDGEVIGVWAKAPDGNDIAIKQYQAYSAPYAGLYAILGDPRAQYNAQKRFMLYRFHVKDEIWFNQSFRMAMDNLGWTGPRYDDYTSTAYWYLDHPASVPFELPAHDEMTMK